LGGGPSGKVNNSDLICLMTDEEKAMGGTARKGNSKQPRVPYPPPAPHFKLVQKSIESSVLQDRVSIAELLSDGISLA
jgi:hypothetical protein